MKFTSVSIFLSFCIQPFAFLGLDLIVPIIDQAVDVGTDGLPIIGQDEDVTFGRTECKKCTEYINGYMSFIQEAARTVNFTQLTANYVPLFSSCTAKGLDTLTLYGDACVNAVSNKPNVSITRSNYEWVYVNFSCIGELSINPMRLNQKIQSLSSTCPTGTTTVNPPNLVSALVTTTSPKCSLLAGIDLSATQTVILNINWINPKASIWVQKDKNIKGLNSTTVVKGEVVERNVSNIHSSCETNSTVFKICDCLTENNVLTSLMESIVEIVGQCVAKSDNKKFKSGLDAYAVCDP